MKKRILSTAVIAIVSMATCFAQYRIYGHVPDLADGMMYLDYGGKTVDSAKVEKGCFTIENKTKLKGAEYVYMHHSSGLWRCMFWMQNDDIDFTTVNDLPVIKGSKTHDEYLAFEEIMNPAWDFGRNLSRQMEKDVAKFDSLRAIMNTTYKAKEDSAFMTFLKKYPSSYISLNHIYNKRNMDKYPYKRYMKFFNELTPGAFEGKQWDVMLSFCEKDRALQPGQPMPKYVMNDVYGKTIDIASFKGKYVLLTLSTYGIKDYDADLELRKQLYGKYHAKGLDMVDHSLATDINEVIKAPAEKGLRWHFVTDLNGFKCPWFNEHGIDHITQNFLIDRNGIIIGRDLFGEELEREINKLF